VEVGTPGYGECDLAASEEIAEGWHAEQIVWPKRDAVDGQAGQKLGCSREGRTLAARQRRCNRVVLCRRGKDSVENQYLIGNSGSSAEFVRI